MPRMTNNDINTDLTYLRTSIRDGNTIVSYREDEQALRNVVAATLGIDRDAFNSENFKPQTLKRFASLFDVPKWPTTGTTPNTAWIFPTQDETAAAIQNFMNRRKNPWSHVGTVTATEADPIASEVQDAGN